MNSRRAFIIWIGLIAISARLGTADDDPWRRPLSNRNQFPLALLFLSLNPERGTVQEKGDRILDLDFDYSNILASHSGPQESLVLDLEYLSSTVRFRAGVGRGLELGAAIPFYIMYGGFLDGFISGLHNAFDLPNRARDATPNNLFRYQYLRDGEPVLERRDGPPAIGDLTFQVKKNITGKSKNELAVRATLKLPTGSPEKLSGSGAADFGLGLAASRVGRRLGGYFNINYLALGNPEKMETKDTFSFMGAFDYRFKPHLAMLVQYEQLQPFLESSISVLDQSARQLVLGLRWKASDRYLFEWRFAEDLSSTSPDFTFGFRLAIHWAGESELSRHPEER